MPKARLKRRVTPSTQQLRCSHRGELSETNHVRLNSHCLLLTTLLCSRHLIICLSISSKIADKLEVPRPPSHPHPFSSLLQGGCYLCCPASNVSIHPAHVLHLKQKWFGGCLSAKSPGTNSIAPGSLEQVLSALASPDFTPELLPHSGINCDQKGYINVLMKEGEKK